MAWVCNTFEAADLGTFTAREEVTGKVDLGAREGAGTFLRATALSSQGLMPRKADMYAHSLMQPKVLHAWMRIRVPTFPTFGFTLVDLELTAAGSGGTEISSLYVKRRSRRPARSACAIALALTAASSCAPALPCSIQDEMAKSRGAVTVVMFTDFQCPFCRRTHDMLEALLEQRMRTGQLCAPGAPPDACRRVRVVLRHVPLAMHRYARSAARAAICSEVVPAPERAGDAFVSALFRAADLSESACEDLAASLGFDRAAFRRCTTDRATDARIDRDVASFDDVSGDGVPLTFVGRRRLDGEPRAADLADAIDAAIAEAK